MVDIPPTVQPGERLLYELASIALLDAQAHQIDFGRPAPLKVKNEGRKAGRRRRRRRREKECELGKKI